MAHELGQASASTSSGERSSAVSSVASFAALSADKLTQDQEARQREVSAHVIRYLLEHALAMHTRNPHLHVLHGNCSQCDTLFLRMLGSSSRGPAALGRDEL